MSQPEIIHQILAHSTPVVQSAPDAWTVQYHLRRNFLGFMGHFPDYPVLPAMIQIIMVRLLIEAAIEKPCILDICNAKFVTPILPDTSIIVHTVRGTPSWKATLLTQQSSSDCPELAATLSVIPKMFEDA